MKVTLEVDIEVPENIGGQTPNDWPLNWLIREFHSSARYMEWLLAHPKKLIFQDTFYINTKNETSEDIQSVRIKSIVKA